MSNEQWANEGRVDDSDSDSNKRTTRKEVMLEIQGQNDSKFAAGHRR